MRAVLAVACALALAACGDDGGGPAAEIPATIDLGIVSLDPANLQLTINSANPIVSDHFLAIGDTAEIDPTHYYDPAGDEVSFTRPDHAVAFDKLTNVLTLDDGTTIHVALMHDPEVAVLDIDTSGHPNAVLMQLALFKGDEPIYGTGDAPITPDVSGSVREMQLRVDLNSASTLNETHVPVPLVMWPRRAAGVLVADDRPGAIDSGKTVANTITATFSQPSRGAYRVYIFTGHEPLDLVRTYTALSARPAVPPRWAFAPQQWRNEWTDGTEMLADASEMRTRHIPGSVMWIDNPWQTAYNTFDVDDARFPQVHTMIDNLTAQGYRVVFWSTPYVDSGGLTKADHDEGTQLHHFVTDDAGVVIDYPWANGPGAMVDFTHDGAAAWWQQRIAKVASVGASGFKLDYGEEIVTDINGSIVPMVLAAGDNQVMHARYAEGYHRTYLGALPQGDGFLISRGGAWGEQATNTAIWPGDLESSFAMHGDPDGGKTSVGGLPSAISRGLSLSVSGYPFYGSDIGGFRGFPTTEVLLRWAEYAAFGTIMQLGGGGKSHDPWDTTLFDAGAADIYATYATLHMQLVPLLWQLAQQAGSDGTPVTRPAKFMFDCACDDQMFLLGDDILIAPVIAAGATTRDVVLPSGAWVDRATGQIVMGDGASSITVPAPLDTIPVWYRAGSIVPMYAQTADTLLPATAAGVTSYDGPLGREIRFVYTPSSQSGSTSVMRPVDDGATVMADGATMSWAAGSVYAMATFDIDARGLAGTFASPTDVTAGTSSLPQVSDVTTCAAPGCWSFDTATKHLQIRVPPSSVSVH